MSNPSQVALELLRNGDLDGAQAIFEYALEQRAAAFGQDDPSIATELANLGNLLAEQNDLQAARRFLERALALHERAFGRDDPEVALDLGNLGLVVLDLGEVDTARCLFDRALTIQLNSFGPEHQHTGVALANLANRVPFTTAKNLFKPDLPANHVHGVGKPIALASYHHFSNAPEPTCYVG